MAGNPGGPGNPFARRVGELRRAMLAAVKPADVADIIKALVAKAKEGHVQAAKLVLSYVLGKPQRVADPDLADVDEWELHEETAAMSQDMAEVLKAPPASVPLWTARTMGERVSAAGMAPATVATEVINLGASRLIAGRNLSFGFELLEHGDGVRGQRRWFHVAPFDEFVALLEQVQQPFRTARADHGLIPWSIDHDVNAIIAVRAWRFGGFIGHDYSR